MKVTGQTAYFKKTREGKHSLVTYEVSVAVAENPRGFFWVRPEDGRMQTICYSLEIGLWVQVVQTADGRLHNGYWLPVEEAASKIARHYPNARIKRR